MTAEIAVPCGCQLEPTPARALTQEVNCDSLLGWPTGPRSEPRPAARPTRRRIVTAARELIAEGGYAEAQVAAVA